MFLKDRSNVKNLIKILILFAIFVLNLRFLLSEPVCESIASQNLPPTPYTAGYMQFDGKGDFLRTQNRPYLDLQYAQTDNFVIETRIKISSPFTPMRILGKYYSTGWMISYHLFQGGVLGFTMGNVNKYVYQLNADTNWHAYKIVFNKQDSTLLTYTDGILTYTHVNYTYPETSNNYAFSIGNIGFGPTYGFNSYPNYGSWFKGGIDLLKVNSNGINLLNYDFDEGAGQVAKDSASYYMTDRVYPGVTGCEALHLMLGFMPAVDTCDPQWMTGDEQPKTNFFPLGTGLSYYINNPGYTSFLESCSSELAVWNGYLVNCGRFNRAGGNAIKNIALWNGSAWLPVGNGLNNEATCAASYKGELYAGGFFDSAYGVGETKHIARWNGSSWQPLGNGVSDLVNVMKEYNGSLIIGGFFMSAGEMYAPKIARWDGNEWFSMGSGMSGPVYSLCEYNGELYAAGNFEYAGGQTANGIAKWNGIEWQPVGNGIHGADNTIYTLCVFQNELWAAGSFTIMDGMVAHNIARYNGTEWTGLYPGAAGLDCSGSGAYVMDMQVFDNSIYFAGMFTKIGGADVNKLARYTGEFWCPVEFGADLRPKDMEIYNGNLIINGDFYSISGQPLSNIAGYRSGNSYLGTGNNNNSPQKFSLMQNYPNPFNPNTKIKYNIPLLKEANAGRGVVVNLIVYDILGNEVSTLVNGKQNAGTYEVTFNGSNSASGVYYYKLVVSDASGSGFTETRKMVLVK